MNINNKNNINKYNIINTNQNQSPAMDVEVFQTQKENQQINEILRNQFVRKVYGILLVQFIITFSFFQLIFIKQRSHYT